VAVVGKVCGALKIGVEEGERAWFVDHGWWVRRRGRVEGWWWWRFWNFRILRAR
jgi:hypothetical protein